MHDSRDENPAKRSTPEQGEPSADAKEAPISAAEAYSQSAFGRGMDAAGVGLALRALEDRDNTQGPEGEMSHVRREMERRAAKEKAKEQGLDQGRGQG